MFSLEKFSLLGLVKKKEKKTPVKSTTLVKKNQPN